MKNETRFHVFFKYVNITSGSTNGVFIQNEKSRIVKNEKTLRHYSLIQFKKRDA